MLRAHLTFAEIAGGPLHHSSERQTAEEAGISRTALRAVYDTVSSEAAGTAGRCRGCCDVVTRHITLVNAQAGVAHHLMRTNPDRAYEALAHIKDNSRAALDELRATVGLLRQPDDTPGSRAPIPRLTDLCTLVGAFRTSGLSVRVARTGTPSPLASATELTAYRIIQEALTNTHKHASATRAAVVLYYGPHALRVTVTDDGRPGAPKGAGTGHGLTGMHERATAIGGTVTAGPRPEGGFQVVAELPLSLAPAAV